MRDDSDISAAADDDDSDISAAAVDDNANA